MDQSTVEDDAALLIAIQAFIEEVMNHSARLRDAEHAGFLHRAGQRIRFGIAVTKERHAITHRGKAESSHARLFGRVNEVVEPAGP